MNLSLSRHALMTGLFVLLSAVAGLGPASAQEDDYLDGDVPEWLEDFGYRDTHESGPVSQDAAEGLEGDSENAAPGTAASPSGQCNCLHCRDKLTGDWAATVRACSRTESRIAEESRSSSSGLGVVLIRRFCLSSAPWAFRVATRSSTRETRVTTS